MEHHPRLKQRAALVSILSNVTLVAGKLIIGFAIGSVSVISEAIHSGVDLVASIIAFVAVRVSHLPPDDEHPYGHGKSENLSGLLEAILIFVAAGWITMEAVKKLMHHELLEKPGLGMAIMLVSSVANWLVSRYLFKIGKETDSMALMADAWHLRTDVWTSLGVMVGLTLIFIGQWLFPGVNLAWLDPVAAIAVALLICHTAWELSLEAGRDLLDARLPPHEDEWLGKLLQQPRDGVYGIHKLRSRKAGNIRFVEFHLLVDEDLSVAVSHQITDDLTAAIRAQFPGTQVLIHVEPADL